MAAAEPLVSTPALRPGDTQRRVSIVVATHNRARCLERQLDRLTTVFAGELASGTADIWVLDDASSDDTPAVCARHGDAIHLLRTEESIGCIEARRRLLEAVEGDYVIQLDDDSYLLDADALDQVRNFFAATPRCGVIAANIATQREVAGVLPTTHPPVPVGSFVECGCAFRAEALRRSGHYAPFLQGIQGEGRACSLRLLEDGHEVMLLAGLRVFHAEDPVERPLISRRVTQLCNELATIAAYYPRALVPLALTHKLLSYIRYNRRQGTLRPVFRQALPLLPGALARGWRERRKVRLRTLVRFYVRTLALARARRRALQVQELPPWPELQNLLAP